MARVYRLDVSYPYSGSIEAIRKRDERIQKAVGTPAGASGAGFGSRDLSFYFTTRAQLKEAMARLEAGKDRLGGLAVNADSYEETS